MNENEILNVILNEIKGIRTNIDVGGAVDAAEILNSYDAIVLCCCAKKARDLNVPGRDAKGA